MQTNTLALAILFYRNHEIFSVIIKRVTLCSLAQQFIFLPESGNMPGIWFFVNNGVRYLSAWIFRHPYLFALLIAWLAVLLSQSAPLQLISDYSGFVFLGVVGAIFANATGAGGGVVFVPFFNHLGLSPDAIVATSFGIQCCGMTAGAITWWRYRHSHHQKDRQWSMLVPGLLLSVPASLVGIWMAQYGAHLLPQLAMMQGDMSQLHLGFGIFSILLALAIFASVPLLSKTSFQTRLHWGDALALPVIAWVGGAITAWLSVGVGELVAVYLIIRGFHVTMAIALAVILSACSVWGAITYHLVISQAIIVQIVLFAGAGAVIGGIVAKRVVLAFSPTRLKLFFGAWVLVMGASGLPVFQ